jgi:hypothetical protein
VAEKIEAAEMIDTAETIEMAETVEANSCRVVSLSYPGVLELWRQRLSSHPDIADLQLVTTSFVQPVSSVPSAYKIVQNDITDTITPGKKSGTISGLPSPILSKNCSEN